MAASYPRNSAGRRLQLSEIANLAGVSISTVSRVLNNKAQTITDEVQQRVLAAIAELSPNTEHGLLKKNITHVGLFSDRLLDPSVDPFHFGILAGIQAECQRRGIHFSYTLLTPELDAATFIREKVKQSFMDGLVFLALDNREVLEKMLGQGLPAVLINARHLDLPVDSFLPDNWHGTIQAVNYLISRGHRRIVHVTDMKRNTIRSRHIAYRTALEEAAIEYDPALIVKTSDVGAAEAYDAMKKFLLNKPPQFTAVFCANDLSAIGTLKALREAGLSVPDDVSVIGFDDIAIAEFTDPPLTTIRVEREALGAKALQGLLDRAANPNQVSYCLEMACKLIERESVGTVVR